MTNVPNRKSISRHCMPQSHASMDFDKSTAPYGTDIPQPSTHNSIDTGHHTMMSLDRILAGAIDTERHIMALLKVILADTTVQGVLPSEDIRAMQLVLAGHAVELNGAGCRFPNCDCRLTTCSTSQPPSTSSVCSPDRTAWHKDIDRSAKIQTSIQHDRPS